MKVQEMIDKLVKYKEDYGDVDVTFSFYETDKTHNLENPIAHVLFEDYNGYKSIRLLGDDN